MIYDNILNIVPSICHGFITVPSKWVNILGWWHIKLISLEFILFKKKPTTHTVHTYNIIEVKHRYMGIF